MTARTRQFANVLNDIANTRTPAMAWLESLGDRPSRLMAETEAENARQRLDDARNVRETSNV